MIKIQHVPVYSYCQSGAVDSCNINCYTNKSCFAVRINIPNATDFENGFLICSVMDQTHVC